jgi:hypothetical protein
MDVSASELEEEEAERSLGEKDAKLAQKLGQLDQPVLAVLCIPTAGIHGPTRIFWANLTPFSR